MRRKSLREEVKRLRSSLKWERKRRLELEVEIGQIRSILNYKGDHLPNYIRSLLISIGRRNMDNERTS